jgi:hypothetical protein
MVSALARIASFTPCWTFFFLIFRDNIQSTLHHFICVWKISNGVIGKQNNYIW